MKKLELQQKIALVAFEVDFYDRREAKPRTLHHERVVLNGGRLNALERLGMTPAGWIAQQFEGMGYAVAGIKKGESLNASVDLNTLWTKAAAEKAVQKMGADVSRFLAGGARE